MRPLRNLALTLLAAAVVAALAWLLLASLALVLALVGPAAGLAYLAWQLKTARVLWKSHGRVPIADGVRVYPAARLRALATVHLVSGLGGLALGCAPAVFLFGHPYAALMLAGAALVALAGSGFASHRVMAGAKSIDLLPPES